MTTKDTWSSQFDPLFDLIFIKLLKSGERRSGKFYEAQPDAPRVTMGIVVSVGPDTKGIVKKGDKVCFKRSEAEIVEMDGNEHALIKESYLLARLKNAEKKA